MMTYDDALYALGGTTPDHWDSVFLEVCHLCDCIDIDRLFDSL